MSTPRIAFRIEGATNAGHVREQNEDCILLDQERGFFAVFDGMGGHNAGDVAARLARDVVSEYIATWSGKRPPRELLERAIQKASGAVYEEANSRRDLHGMGTTIVCALIADEDRILVAHVGDSRAYLMRDGHLRSLTRDHTVVAELLDRGAIQPDEAVHHPYKSVLSRNLGGKPTTRVDIAEVELSQGDQLLLCSDGLYGYASHDAVQQVLSGAENPKGAVADLIDLALRGGGGDNVTVIVLEAGQPEVPESTQIVRTAGANAWWSRRERFLEEARARGLVDSPICALLSPEEAIHIVAGNLCEAIFHDLEQTTGINVWTFTENLANGWLDQGGDYRAIRYLLDQLREAAVAVVGEIAEEAPSIAIHLEVSLLRVLVVAELAVADALADRVRSVESELVRRDLDHTAPPTVTEEKTVPFMGAFRADPPSPAVSACLDDAVAAANAELAKKGPNPQTHDVLAAAHQAALDFAADSDVLGPARDLYGGRFLQEKSIAPLLDAMDEARFLHLWAARNLPVDVEVKAATVRRVATAHQSLAHAIGLLIADACQSITDDLKAVIADTAALRVEVGRGEAELAELERKYAALRRGSNRRDDLRKS